MGQVQRLLTLAMTFGTVDDPASLTDEALEALGGGSTLREQARTVAQSLESDPDYIAALELAAAAHALVRRGVHEARACRAVLNVFATVGGRRPPPAETEPESALRAGLAVIPPSVTPPRAGTSTQLESVVVSAARSIGAEYGSLFLLDEQTQELVFAVSLRERLEELESIRVPLGRGIAGLVAVTAQPIAVSDVARDPRHAVEIAQQTGYTPRNLLCVPVQSGDRLVGVLELLDKTGDQTFTIDDMQVVEAFANQAAQTIERSTIHGGVVRLVARGLRGLMSPSSELDLSVDAAEDPVFRASLELASLIVAITTSNAQLVRACTAVIEAIGELSSSTSGRQALIG